MSALVSRRPARGETADPATAPSSSLPPPPSPSSPHSRRPPSSPSHHAPSGKAAKVPPTVTKGNRLAQFLILSALSCVLYQFVTNGGGQLTMKTDHGASGSSGGGGGSNSGSSNGAIQFGSSEYTVIMACMGLFGLMRHKTKEAAKQGEDDEEQDEIVRELLLTEKRVRNQKRKQDAAMKNASFDTLAVRSHDNSSGFEKLPQEVLHELLLFLSPQDLSQCPIVSKQWNAIVGDDADELWKLVFLRDFKESGERFQVVFPIDSWRQFYFQHHLSRAVELARLFGLQEDKKLCVAIENQVYDVTSFIHSHPGGYHVIGDVVGTDATEIWDQFQHSKEAKESMKEFMVYDHILSDADGDKKNHSFVPLKGNLAVVITRWQRISWCLANSRNFGPMASAFTDVMFKFHSRSIKKSRESARLGLAR